MSSALLHLPWLSHCACCINVEFFYCPECLLPAMWLPLPCVKYCTIILATVPCAIYSTELTLPTVYCAMYSLLLYIFQRPHYWWSMFEVCRDPCNVHHYMLCYGRNHLPNRKTIQWWARKMQRLATRHAHM